MSTDRLGQRYVQLATQAYGDGRIGFQLRTFAGEVDIFDRSGSSFGKGWQISGLIALL